MTVLMNYRLSGFISTIKLLLIDAGVGSDLSDWDVHIWKK